MPNSREPFPCTPAAGRALRVVATRFLRLAPSALFGLVLFCFLFAQPGMVTLVQAASCSDVWYTDVAGRPVRYNEVLAGFTSYNGDSETWAVSIPGRATVGPQAVFASPELPFPEAVKTQYGDYPPVPSDAAANAFIADVFGRAAKSAGAQGFYIGLQKNTYPAAGATPARDAFITMASGAAAEPAAWVEPAYVNWAAGEPAAGDYAYMDTDGAWHTTAAAELPGLFRFPGKFDCAVPYQSALDGGQTTTSTTTQCSDAFEAYEVLNGKTYAISKQPLTWANARQLAANNGGKLLRPEDQGVSDYLVSAYASKFTVSALDGVAKAWIGLYDPEQRQQFCHETDATCTAHPERFTAWDGSANPAISGTDSLLVNWHAGQPDNRCTVAERQASFDGSCYGENWVAIDAAGKWSDEGNHGAAPLQLKAIVQWDKQLDCTKAGLAVNQTPGEDLGAPVCQNQAHTTMSACIYSSEQTPFCPLDNEVCKVDHLCPAGFHYADTTKRCEAPLCPNGGTFDAASQQCLTTVTTPATTRDTNTILASYNVPQSEWTSYYDAFAPQARLCTVADGCSDVVDYPVNDGPATFVRFSIPNYCPGYTWGSCPVPGNYPVPPREISKVQLVAGDKVLVFANSRVVPAGQCVNANLRFGAMVNGSSAADGTLLGHAEGGDLCSTPTYSYTAAYTGEHAFYTWVTMAPKPNFYGLELNGSVTITKTSSGPGCAAGTLTINPTSGAPECTATTTAPYSCPAPGVFDGGACHAPETVTNTCPSDASRPCYTIDKDTSGQTFCTPNPCVKDTSSFYTDNDTEVGTTDVAAGELDADGNCAGNILFFNGKDSRCIKKDVRGSVASVAKIVIMIVLSCVGAGVIMMALAAAASSVAGNAIEGQPINWTAAGIAAVTSIVAQGGLSELGSAVSDLAGSFADTAVGQAVDSAVTAVSDAWTAVSDTAGSVWSSVTGTTVATTAEATSENAAAIAVESATKEAGQQTFMQQAFSTIGQKLGFTAEQSLAAQSAVSDAMPVLEAGMTSSFKTTKCCYPDKMKASCVTDRDQYQLWSNAKMGLCHGIGTYCATKWFSGCVSTKQTYCCYNSRLARIFHEQGRPQLKAFTREGATTRTTAYCRDLCKDTPFANRADPDNPNGGCFVECMNEGVEWGSPRSPYCRGFTPEEFQMVDFGAIDFTEFVTEVVQNQQEEFANKFKTKLDDFHKTGLGNYSQPTLGTPELVPAANSPAP